MAKKRGKTKRSTKRSARRTDLTLQLLKILGGITLLVMVVLGAGFLADLFLGKPADDSGAAVRQNVHIPTPPAESPQKPVYEIFSKDSPPAKALKRLPQLPGDSPPIAAIIIDDIGYDRHIADQFMALDVPLTFSMLPYGTFSRSISTQARSKGLEIMLHLPMEPNEYPEIKPGPGAILSSMSPDDLITQLKEDIDQFTGLKGVNNHMGSRISTSPEQMRQIFSILKKRGLYYIDSRTTVDTVAVPSARLLQLPYAERDIFIDHFEDSAFIQSQLQRLITRAKKQGYAVGIAHPHAITFEVLKEFLPHLKAEVAIVPASMVVQRVTLAEMAKSQAAR